jgi:hypothetical protein
LLLLQNITEWQQMQATHKACIDSLWQHSVATASLRMPAGHRSSIISAPT